MAKVINVPGVGAAKVPDNATDADIVAFVKKVQAAGSVKAAYDQAIADRPGAVMSGIYGAGAALTAAGAAAAEGRFDPLANDLYGVSQSLREESRKYVPEIGSIENIGSVGDAFTYAGEVAGQSLPYMAATVLGGIGGGIVGGPAGGLAGATAVGLPLFTGENIIAQAEADKVPLRETDAGRAFTYAVPQVALDVASLGVGGKLIQGFRRANQAAQRGVARQVVTHFAKAGATESLTETSQQALQILQADPDRLMEMDDATVSELLNAAVAGGVLGGVLGGGVESYQAIRGQKAQEQEQNLRDTIQREADQGRGVDLRSETNLGVEALQLKKASPNLEIKPIKKVIKDDAGADQEVSAFTIRDLGDKSKGKVNIGEFANEDAAKDAVSAYQSMIAKTAGVPTLETPQITPQAPKTNIKKSITGVEKTPVQPPLPAEAPTVAPGLGKAISELPKAPDTPIPEAPATFDKQREALQRGTRAAMLYNEGDTVPPKLVNPQIKRIKLDDGRTIDFNRGKFTEPQVREAVANNRLNEVLELGPFNKDEALASELRGNAPVAVVERTPDGVEVKAAAGTTETAPTQIAALEQTKTAPENIVAIEPVQDLVAGRIAPELTADERVAIWKSVAPQAQSFRDLAPEQQAEYFVRLKAAQDARAKQAAPSPQPKPIIKKPSVPAKAAKPAPPQEQDIFSDLSDDLLGLYADDAPKSSYRAFVKRAIKLGAMTENDAKELEYIFKDRDMSRDDLNSEIDSILRVNESDQKDKKKLSAAPAGGVSPEPVPAVAVLASRPELADKVGEAAKKRLAAMGLGKVALKIKTAVESGQFGRYGEGVYDPATKSIEISLSAVDPKASDEEFITRLSEIVDHEAIHAVVNLGVLTKEEFASLLQTAETTKYPGSSFTYLERAFATYSTLKQYKNPDGTVNRLAVSEEAVAEMFRDWNAGRLRVQDKPRGLFTRIREFFRRLRGAANDAGFAKVFEEIKSGEIAKRQATPTDGGVRKFAIAGQPGSDSTQVATTTGSYRKAAEHIKRTIPNAKNILDYGAGRGLGSDAMRQESGIRVDSYEPIPTNWQSEMPLTFKVTDQISEKYDGVVNLNVLNVLEPKLREEVVIDIIDKIAPGGVAVIGVRKFKGDVDTAKNSTPAQEEKAIWVKKPSGPTYQKGFDGNELVDYLKGIVPPGYTVERGPKVGATSAVIRAPKADARKFSIPARLTGESEQEFKQWWKSSKAVDRNGKPQVFYHGRPRPLREGQFNRGASGALPGEEGPYYFSPVSWFADQYASRDMSKGGDRRPTETGTMYPVFLSAQNPWDYNNPRHVDDVVEYIANGLESGKIDLSELKLTRAGVPSVASLKKIGIFLESGDWDAVEVPAVQRAIRDLGFDGFYLVEEDVRNLAVYKPQQIKSIYNQFEPGTATSRKLSIAPQLATSTQDRQSKAFSLFPYLRSMAARFFPNQRRLINAGTNPGNAEENLANLDGLLSRHPNTLASEQAFADYMAEALGKAASRETGVPLVPYNAVKIANDPTIIEEQLRSLTQGQLDQASDGFAGAAKLRKAYRNGSATIEHTGKLLLWGILSRGVSPFVQESMFLDAVNGHGNVGGVNRFIEAAAKGEFNLDEYNDWLKLVVPEGSTGAGSTHNLGAFGKTTLTKLQQRLPDGKTVFERLHEIIADYSLSGREARREFHKINSGIGVNNKVISFMLLVSGRNDILVLDRVQMRNQFDDGRFEGYNLYDGEKIRNIQEDGTEGKAQTVTGTAIAGLGDGVMGLVYYEALERDLEAAIRTAYAAVGRGNEASLGRYHWESWVASSAQEVDHGTITGIINDALGQVDPYGLVTTSEGKYDTYMSGAKYGYTKDGQAYVALPDGLGNNYVFTPRDAKEVVKGYKKKSLGIIDDPDTFRVSESRTGAWYERPEINRNALRNYLAGQIERKRNFVEPVPKPREKQPDVYRPRLGRNRVGKVTSGKTASDIADKYIKKLSVAPAYNNVKQFTQADTDKVIDGLTYGAATDGLQRLLEGMSGNAVVKKFLPARFTPGKRASAEFMRKFVDKMLPLGELIDHIRKNGGTVADAMDTYMQEDLMHSTVAEDLREREAGLYKRVFDYVRANNITLKATEQEAARGQYGLEDYLYARHAGERNKRIRELGNKDPEKGSGMTDAEAKEILDAVNRMPQASKIKEAAKLFDEIIADTNKIRMESGLTPDFKAMEVEDEDGNKVVVDMTVYDHYAPLRGFAEENPDSGLTPEEEMRARVGTGLNVRGREDKQAMGRKSRASDIIAHAITQNTEAVIRGGKNRVGNSLIKLVETNPQQAEEFGIKILKKAPTKAIINKNGVIQTMVDLRYQNRPDILIVKAMPDVAKGLKGGEQVIFEVSNEALQKAIVAKKVAGPAMAEKLLTMAQGVNRWIALVNTGINPEFMLTNFPRDLQTALINIEQYKSPGIRKKIMKDVMPAMRGAWNVIRNPEAKGKWEDIFREFKQNGGMTAGISGINGVQERIQEIGKLMKEPTGSYAERAKLAGGKAIDMLLDMNSAVENAIRVSVYKNLADNGFTQQRAAQAAKNLTVNFDKRGEYGPTLNALYLFFNASVQGSFAIAMAAARSPRVRKILGGIVVLGLMQDIINSLLSPDDEDGKSVYDKIPDYKLRSNIIIMDPFGITGDRGYISIPMPYGYNAVFNFGRTLGRKLRGEYSTLEATNNIVGTFVDAFNPIGGTENLLNAISPTVVDPVVSLYLNEDFTGRKIYPEAFPGAVPKADSNTFWTTTSPSFKSLAQFLNSATGGSEYVPGAVDISPDVMEYWYDYFLGGAGAFVRRTWDTATSTIPSALRGDLEEVEINNIPILRKVVGNVSDRVITEGYMANANYLLARGKELDSAIKSGDPVRIKETREKYKEELRVYPRVKSLVNRRNKIASDLRKVRENPRIPQEQKRVRIQQMQRQIVDITVEVNKIYEKVNAGKFPDIF